ncbi:MAG: hypothetical protein RMJ98_17200 [Myxococcales bacterium]|nr:hypothetical protein [Polyangiaceae bacterium]MDW8251034.1 hypothetical protein [Myxococcales bacterium]
MKILVVEDNKKLARFLEKALIEEGYEAEVVGNGEAAVYSRRIGKTSG